jgi:WS/DGAT/MGAT family acyltransferase
MLARGLIGVPRYPLRLLGSVPRALPNVREVPSLSGIPGLKTAGRIAATAQRALGRSRLVGEMELVPPRTSFNGRVSAHRRFAFTQLSLQDVREIKNVYGFTVNDVIVSICAGSVRRWLTAHEELPDEPLVAQIPVSVRTQEQQGTFGNRILLMTAPLYTKIDDPVERLRETHEALVDMKQRHRALPADLLRDANQFVPPALFSRAAQLTFSLSASKRGRPAWNLVVSNVPGPQIPLYMAGARLEAQYPISVITDGMGLNITVMSYCGQLNFGIVGDREQMPDIWSVSGWLREALDELRTVPAARDAPAAAPKAGYAGGAASYSTSPGRTSRAKRSLACCISSRGVSSDPGTTITRSIPQAPISSRRACTTSAGPQTAKRSMNRASSRRAKLAAASPWQSFS